MRGKYDKNPKSLGGRVLIHIGPMETSATMRRVTEIINIVSFGPKAVYHFRVIEISPRAVFGRNDREMPDQVGHDGVESGMTVKFCDSENYCYLCALKKPQGFWCNGVLEIEH